MKQETVCIIDGEIFGQMSNMDVLTMLIEFGAPIEIDESVEEKPIEIHDKLNYAYYSFTDQIVYEWFKEIEKGPGGITIWVKNDHTTEVHTREAM